MTTGMRRENRLEVNTRSLIALLVLIGLSACQGQDASGVPDSSDAQAVSRWEVSDEPLSRRTGVQIGADSVFFDSVTRGTFLPSGDMLVSLRGGEIRLLLLDSLGEFKKVVGREGEGPGEFKRIIQVSLNGDTAAIWDRLHYRATRVSGGELLDDLPLPRETQPALVGVTTDGLAVTTPMQPLSSSVPGGVRQGQRRPYHLTDPAGETVGMLEGIPEPPPSAVDLFSGDGRPTGGYVLGPLCAPETAHMVDGSRVLIADAARGEFSSLGRDGKLTTLYTSSHRDTVSADYVAMRRSMLENVERASEASRQDVLDRVGEVGSPLPNVWSDMIRDVSGGVWLERAACYARWFRWESTVWEALDEQWSFSAEVHVPTDLTLLSVSRDRVLALSFDDLDVPHLGVYPVRPMNEEPN